MLVNEFYDLKIGGIVKYTGATDAQIKWGSNSDPRGLLEKDKEYIIEEIDVRSYHTKLKLEGVEGVFNSVSFLTIE